MSAVQKIVKIVVAILSIGIPAFPSLPQPLLQVGALTRPGMNAKLIQQRIIQRKKELGLPTGKTEDGENSADDAVIFAIVDEIINAIKTESKVEVAAIPGTIQTIGAGGNQGGPVLVNSAIIGFPTMNGVMA